MGRSTQLIQLLIRVFVFVVFSGEVSERTIRSDQLSSHSRIDGTDRREWIRRLKGMGRDGKRWEGMGRERQLLLSMRNEC